MKTGLGRPCRVLAGICLFVSATMLIGGLTLFAPRLTGAAFLTYWLICFLATGAAAILALLDVAMLRRQLRQEQRELIKSTLTEASSNNETRAGSE